MILNYLKVHRIFKLIPENVSLTQMHVPSSSISKEGSIQILNLLRIYPPGQNEISLKRN